jgi:NADPH:quinone reductase-like Zn-dependent oxidoreductase
VRRLKNGLSVEQPVVGDELRAVKRYLATRTDNLPWLFVSERGQPLTRQSVNYLVAGAAARAAVPTHRPAALPDPVVSFEHAAALPVAGITALRMLRHGEPLLGRRVLVTGATGGVGAVGCPRDRGG